MSTPVSPDDEDDARQWQRWRRLCDEMPPMTADQIQAVGSVLREIDQHRARQRRAREGDRGGPDEHDSPEPG
jgi:hypothetical protein